MKKVITHLLSQPFILSTGIAALIHSTWSLGTLFDGTEPTFGLNWLAWLLWVIPPLLLAFSLDVGQIITSYDIRHKTPSRARYAAFIVFAFATYFLQYLYIVTHMPNIALGAGVRNEWVSIVTLIRDCAIWILPALLPISTVLYTFSNNKGKQTTDELNAVQEEGQILPAVIPISDDIRVLSYGFKCKLCGQEGNYGDASFVQRYAKTHLKRKHPDAIFEDSILLLTE